MLNRWFSTLSVEVWRRAARMAQACLPGDSTDVEFIFTGERADVVVSDAAVAAGALIPAGISAGRGVGLRRRLTIGGWCYLGPHLRE